MDKIEEFLKIAIYLGGTFGLSRWIISDWRKKSADLEKAKEEAVNNAISSIKKIVEILQYDMDAFRERLIKLEANFELMIKNLSSKTEDIQKLMVAMRGFVETVHTRLSTVEETVVDEIGKDIFYVRSKKGDGSK